MATSISPEINTSKLPSERFPYQNTSDYLAAIDDSRNRVVLGQSEDVGLIQYAEPVMTKVFPRLQALRDNQKRLEVSRLPESFSFFADRHCMISPYYNNRGDDKRSGAWKLDIQGYPTVRISTAPFDHDGRLNKGIDMQITIGDTTQRGFHEANDEELAQIVGFFDSVNQVYDHIESVNNTNSRNQRTQEKARRMRGLLRLGSH